MAKPTDIPTWATDATYSSGPELGEVTKIEPSAGFQAEGFKPGSYPRPENVNWWQNLVYQWVDWLDTFFTIDGSDTLTLPAVLIVPGATTVGGNLQASTSLEVLGDALFEGDLELQGELYHGDMVLNIPGSAGITSETTEREFEFSGYTASIDIKTLPATANTTVFWPIPLRVGDRIKSVAFRVLAIDTGVAGTIASADVKVIADDGSTVASATSGAVSPSTVTPSTTTVNIADTVLATNQHVFAALVMSAVQDNEVGMRVYGVDVTYDRPV